MTTAITARMLGWNVYQVIEVAEVLEFRNRFEGSMEERSCIIIR